MSPYRTDFRPRCRAMIEVVFDGRGAPNSKSFHIEIDPHDATVGLNGFYEADTFSMSFPTRNLPFDPDQIAYCAARIYMWDASSVSDSSYEWAVDENMMIAGLVDDVETKIVGEDTLVHFTGRDYTALLIDAQWNPKDNVKHTGETNLKEIVQSIADEAAPEGTRARFEVVWEGEDPIPPPLMGLHRSSMRKGLWVKPGKSFWDVIWDLCVQHAYVPHVRGSQLVISEPVTQTKQSLTTIPRLIYGKHLTKLDLKRKFSRQLVPQIVIVAWDPIAKKRIEVKYPEKRNVTIAAKDALGIPLTVKKDEQMFFPGPAGVTDATALKRYAKMRFYHLGRGETVYSMGTKHLSVESQGFLDNLGIGDQEFNLLRLRPGAAVGIRFDPFNQEHLRALEVGQRVDHIVAQGYSEEIATFVALNLDNIELFKQDYYYNRGDVQWSLDEGIEIEIECMNFASEVREIKFAT